MKSRSKAAAALSLGVTLVLTLSGTSFAASTLVDKGDTSTSFQQTNGIGVPLSSTPLKPSVGSLFREVPSISGRYSVGDMTLFPYIGAGYGGGYSSELDRAIAPIPQPQQNLSFGNQMGQTMVPNEFQMGIRIPF